MIAAEINAAVWTAFLRSSRFIKGDRVCLRYHADRAGVVCGFFTTREIPAGVTFELPGGYLMNVAQEDLQLLKSAMEVPR